MLLSSHEEGSYLLDAEVHPVAKASVATGREDDRVEAVEELGIFQLLDRLEEVTSMLTSR
jgi:exosome complex RNA-binding protein Rrp42 (RNase PH superfamily)